MRRALTMVNDDEAEATRRYLKAFKWRVRYLYIPGAIIIGVVVLLTRCL